MIAQAIRVVGLSGYEPGGREFESLRARHFSVSPRATAIRGLACAGDCRAGLAGARAGRDRLPSRPLQGNGTWRLMAGRTSRRLGNGPEYWRDE